MQMTENTLNIEIASIRDVNNILEIQKRVHFLIKHEFITITSYQH
jgi:hypothetical protein